MKADKKKRLKQAGWKTGTAAEFLGLSEEESALIEMKLALARGLKRQRMARQLTQEELARRLKSSQSRVAKMEAADPGVSVDLLVRALLVLEVPPKEIGRLIAQSPATPAA